MIGKVPQTYAKSRLHTYEVDGLVVVTTLDREWLAAQPDGGRAALSRLAREHGRPLPAGESEAL